MERKVRTIKAMNTRGQVVHVDEYQEFIDTTSHGMSTRQYTPGLKRLELRDGGAVNFVDEQTFQVVATGETLRIP